MKPKLNCFYIKYSPTKKQCVVVQILRHYNNDSWECKVIKDDGYLTDLMTYTKEGNPVLIFENSYQQIDEISREEAVLYAL